MTEERRFAILIAATILSARKLAELEDPDKATPKKLAAVETAIRHAAYILGRSTRSGRQRHRAAFGPERCSPQTPFP